LGAYRIPLETGLLIPSDKRVSRKLGFWQKPDDDKRTSRELVLGWKIN
jgi:hypothetical protein